MPSPLKTEVVLTPPLNLKAEVAHGLAAHVFRSASWDRLHRGCVGMCSMRRERVACVGLVGAN